MKKCMGCMEEYEESLTICPHCGYVEGTQPAEVNHMMPGSILSGKYIVGRTLGYGGFGVTYIGYDAELERKVAVKEYLPGEFSTRIPGQTQVTVYEGEGQEQFQSGIEKFMDEAKRLAKFQNTAGIVHIYDSFFENDTAYIVMEYVDGETLKAKIDREGKMSEEEALKVILPIVAALKEVHAAGILHRDIAPDNIMLDKEGNARLIDFGASRFATTTHSKSLSVLIKPGYAPVEQYQSRGQQGPWTDVYALAATFYTLLTGLVPTDSMERLGKDDLKSPLKAGAKVSKNIDTAIRNAMNLKVEERTSSMEAFENELLSDKEVARLVVKKEKNDVGKWPVWTKAAIGTAAAAIVCFMALLLTGVISFSGGKLGSFVVAVGKTIVPNMVNVTIETAENAATSNKLEIQIVGKVYSDEIPEGYVLNQNMQAGSKVDEGSVLELTISAGVEMVFMPSVVGLTKEAAIALLEEQELKYTIEEVESMTIPGNIVSQSVSADEKIAKGTEITLQVSGGMTGIDTTVEVPMPDLQGMDYTEAQNVLANLGLYIGKESEVYNNSVQKNGIVYQSVPAGNVLHQGDIVTVQVSRGKEQARVPDVWLEDESTARQMLSDAGLIADVSYESSATVSKGLVISQGTEKDTLVDVGTRIKIVVSTGKEETKEPEKEETKEPEKESEKEPEKEPEKEQVKEWSGWVDSLPAGVTADKYEIETKTEYSRRDKTTISSADSTLASQGWTLESTSTQPGEWGAWSDWSTTAQTSSDTKEVETETRYQYRDKQTKTSSSSSMSGWTLYDTKTTWSAWSDWSDTAVSSSSTRNVETRTVNDTSKPINTTYYRYHRYTVTYYNSASSTQLTYVWRASYDAMMEVYNNAVTQGKRSVTKEDYTSDWSTERKTYQNDTVGYGDHLFNEETKTEITGYQQKTQYRYQDATYTYYYYKWSDWSSPSTNPVTSSDTREVKSATYYRYRSRSIISTYTYSQWSDWSAYGDTAISPSATTEVRTKTQYRYKEK